jgi:hypothetical protein
MLTTPSAPLCCCQLSCLQSNTLCYNSSTFCSHLCNVQRVYSVWKKAPAFMASSTRVSRRFAATANSTRDEHLLTLPPPRHLYSPAHHTKNHRGDPVSVYHPPLNSAFISECTGKVAFYAIRNHIFLHHSSIVMF